MLELIKQSMLSKAYFFLIILTSGNISFAQNIRESYRVIENIAVFICNEPGHVINSTCDQCICVLHFNVSFSSFNYNRIHQQCYFHLSSNETHTLSVIPNNDTSFYFISIPNASEISIKFS